MGKVNWFERCTSVIAYPECQKGELKASKCGQGQVANIHGNVQQQSA